MLLCLGLLGMTQPFVSVTVQREITDYAQPRSGQADAQSLHTKTGS